MSSVDLLKSSALEPVLEVWCGSRNRELYPCYLLAVQLLNAVSSARKPVGTACPFHRLAHGTNAIEDSARAVLYRSVMYLLNVCRNIHDFLSQDRMLHKVFILPEVATQTPKYALLKAESMRAARAGHL